MKIIALLAVVLVPGSVACDAADSAASNPQKDTFRFGLVADVQYGDKPDSGARHYRLALDHFEACVDQWNESKVEFSIQLGDLIDGHDSLEQSIVDLDAVLAVVARMQNPLRHVLGNHCLSIPRDELLPRLGLTDPYYALRLPGWRFLFIDSLDVSICCRPEGSEPYALAQAWMTANAGAPNAKRWNGALGAEQLAWIEREIAAAEGLGEHVALFSHLAGNPAAGSASLALFNHPELVAVLVAHDNVVAFINGHDHEGSYGQVDGVHYLTLPAMCDAPAETNAFAVVDAYPDRLELTGYGNVESRVLRALR